MLLISGIIMKLKTIKHDLFKTKTDLIAIIHLNRLAGWQENFLNPKIDLRLLAHSLSMVLFAMRK